MKNYVRLIYVNIGWYMPNEYKFQLYFENSDLIKDFLSFIEGKYIIKNYNVYKGRYGVIEGELTILSSQDDGKVIEVDLQNWLDAYDKRLFIPSFLCGYNDYLNALQSVSHNDYLNVLQYALQPTTKGKNNMRYLINLDKIVFNEEKGRTTLVFKDAYGNIKTSTANLQKGDKWNTKLGFLVAYMNYFYEDWVGMTYGRYGRYTTQLIVHLETLVAQKLVSTSNLSRYQIYKLFDNLDKEEIVFGDGDKRKVIEIERK